jgi:hypothetical protein
VMQMMIMPVSTPVIVLAFCVTQIIPGGQGRRSFSISEEGCAPHTSLCRQPETNVVV